MTRFEDMEAPEAAAMLKRGAFEIPEGVREFLGRPMVNEAAIGGLAGAGLGAASGMLSEGGLRDRGRRAIRGLLTGGIAGGLGGAGVGAIRAGLRTGDSPAAVPAGDAPGKSGLPADFVRKNPDLVNRISELDSPDPETQVAEGVLRGAGGAAMLAPITTATGVGLGVKGVAEGANPGGLTRLTARSKLAPNWLGNWAAGTLDKDLFRGLTADDAMKNMTGGSGGGGKTPSPAPGGPGIAKSLQQLHPDRLRVLLRNPDVLTSGAVPGLNRGRLDDILRAGAAARPSRIGAIRALAGAGLADVALHTGRGLMAERGRQQEVASILDEIRARRGAAR